MGAFSFLRGCFKALQHFLLLRRQRPRNIICCVFGRLIKATSIFWQEGQILKTEIQIWKISVSHLGPVAFIGVEAARDGVGDSSASSVLSPRA